jgi:phenol hydroxylase P5 protein
VGGLKVRITGAAGETVVEVAEGRTILDGALRAGAWMPHSCTQGTCGTCKLTVLQGTVDHGASPEYTLGPEERAQGMALACKAVPESDLVVRMAGSPPRDGVFPIPLADHAGTVVELTDIATDTRRLVVELDGPMRFHAGQYAELVVPHSGEGRQYSMANPPDEDRRLEFHVKRQPGGAATDGWLFRTAAAGDRLSLRGPLGQFSLAERQEEPAILIGGGTGLAPLKSIVRHALAHDLLPTMHLYHGGRRRADLYDVDFFRELEAQNPHFHYHQVLSEDGWDGRTGLVTDAVIADFPTCRGMSAYVCGPPAMVEAAVKGLKRRRMAPRLIFREEFTPRDGAATTGSVS